MYGPKSLLKETIKKQEAAAIKRELEKEFSESKEIISKFKMQNTLNIVGFNGVIVAKSDLVYQTAKNEQEEFANAKIISQSGISVFGKYLSEKLKGQPIHILTDRKSEYLGLDTLGKCDELFDKKQHMTFYPRSGCYIKTERFDFKLQTILWAAEDFLSVNIYDADLELINYLCEHLQARDDHEKFKLYFVPDHNATVLTPIKMQRGVSQ